MVVNRDSRAFLLHNVVQPRGHWVMLRVLEEHGRDALGAEVTMTVGSRTIRRDVRAALSYLASNDPRVHVGLGERDDGTECHRQVAGRRDRERFGDLQADRIAVLRRGSGQK